jgi:hypothetical protein
MAAMPDTADRQPRARLIRGGTVIDGTGAPPKPGNSVLIDGDSIAAVGPDAEFGAQPNAEVIGARGLTVMPGLIDCHVHIGHSNDAMGAKWRCRWPGARAGCALGFGLAAIEARPTSRHWPGVPDDALSDCSLCPDYLAR